MKKQSVEKVGNFWIYYAALAFIVLSFLVLKISNNISNEQWINKSECRIPKYWCVIMVKELKSDQHAKVKKVLDYFGFNSADGFSDSDWDVLWSYEFVFTNQEINKIWNITAQPLKPHQKVNHIPGLNAITSKSFMSSRNQDIPGILPGFIFPADRDKFEEFVKKNPNGRFVVKDVGNRGVKLVNRSEISFDKSERQFYQYFMERPMLIDDRAMDFSVHFVITSFNPLRIFRYQSNAWIRFCKEPYYPFDPNNTDKYVISESRTWPEEMPSLKNNLAQGYNLKSAVQEVFRAKGFNISDLYTKIDNTVATLVHNNEHFYIRMVKP